MKKTLLLLAILAASNLQAQFWTEKATTFTTASRGVDDISIASNSVIWVKAYDGASTSPNPPSVREYAKSIDGGNTWTSGTINLGTGGTSLNVSSIMAVSATTAWVTAFPTSTTKGGVWKTVNGGTDWTKQTSALFNTGTDSFTNLVYFWDANNGVVQGDPASGYFEIYTTVDGGTTWTRVPSANIPAPLTEEYGYVHNYDVVGNTIWFGTNKGRLFKSTDKGLNWTVSQSPVTDFGGETVSASYSFSDANNGLLVSGTGALHRTTDGGTTWAPRTFTGPLGSNEIEYVPGTSTVVSLGSAPNYGSSYSFDNGATWTAATTATQYTVLKFTSPTVGFAGGFTTSATVGGIYKYTGTVLGTDDFVTSEKLVAYPNPANDLLQLNGVAINEITVYDILGKQVMNQKFAAQDHINLNTSSLESGMYVLVAVADNGAKETLKFAKK